MELEEIYKQIEQATIDLCPKWKDCAAERNMRSNLLKYIKLNQEKEARIKELEKDNAMYRKIVNENSLRAKIDLWEKDIKELESKLMERDVRIKELEASQPKWISFDDKVPSLYQNILVNVPGANKENRMEPTRSIFWYPAREDELKHGMLYYTHWMPLPNPPENKTP